MAQNNRPKRAPKRTATRRAAAVVAAASESELGQSVPPLGELEVVVDAAPKLRRTGGGWYAGSDHKLLLAALRRQRSRVDVARRHVEAELARRDRLILAARSAGLHDPLIALQLGISTQAVHQRVGKR